ncbi:serine/threonine protein kinase [Aeoliella mucimassa]|uniref:Serine/threonine-protein kinase PknB n=1 Tax=Aeoliella mucimassa TaxID=2527972 RepID=A0A518AMA1_9BACT|nr:serine/threonine-protein kinase [Aeoliella mucimassa]QDU55853.1 Serine/threonine-protein kinase PknB [Aeoliella mucimassa]
MFHLIRAGGVYQIWAVRPMSENKLYAMKWLPPGEKYTRRALTELRHEFAVGKTLDHPEVIKTYDFQTTNNGAYMLLEIYKSPNMKQRIVTDPFDIKCRAKEILINCASGLAHMHERGWVHRDVKPDNFLVGDDSEVRVIDFNLARKIKTGLSKIFSGKAQVQGTHSYMAPEQIRGQHVDPRADVYSLGCVAYELFNGKPPFTANSFQELLTKHLKSKPPDLTVIDKNITPEFAAFVQRMMAKDANDRPATMKDAQMELRSLQLFYSPPKPPKTAEHHEEEA